MKSMGQILLLVGGLVLALLVGILIGRGQRAEPTPAGNAAAVQITTAPPPVTAPSQPLPASLPPPALPAPKPAPDQQVQEDAAAVGMTTREPADQGEAPAPKSAAGDSSQPQSQPVG